MYVVTTIMSQAAFFFVHSPVRPAQSCRYTEMLYNFERFFVLFTDVHDQLVCDRFLVSLGFAELPLKLGGKNREIASLLCLSDRL